MSNITLVPRIPFHSVWRPQALSQPELLGPTPLQKPVTDTTTQPGLMCKDTSLAAQWFSIHVYRCTLRVCSKINPTTGNCLTVSFPKFHAQTCTIDRRFGTEPKLVARETNEAWARTAEGAQEIATRHSAVEWCVCVFIRNKTTTTIKDRLLQKSAVVVPAFQGLVHVYAMDEGSLFIVRQVFLCDKVVQKKGKSFSETSNVSQQPNLKEMAHGWR